MLTRKRFILLYTAIFLFFGIPYVIHLTKYYTAKARIDSRNRQFEAKFNAFKAELEETYKREYSGDLDFFNHYFSLNDAAYYTDTTVSFFIYWDQLEIKHYKEDYLECLARRAKSAAINSQSDIALEEELQRLKDKYGEVAERWLKILAKERFFIYRSDEHCKAYFGEYDTYRLNPDAVRDFENFIHEVEKQELAMEVASELNKIRYEEAHKNLKQELNSLDWNKFEQNLKSNPALRTDHKSFRYTGDGLGRFDYYLTYQNFDQEQWDRNLEFFYNDKYRFNSLRNGAMPYSYCYGDGNSGPSRVKVQAGSSDVLVSVKTTSGKVIRHFYVTSHNTFSVGIPNGTYYIHFYYGSGWNPKKYMTKAHCGSLFGGFINDEVVSQVPETRTIVNTEYTVMLYEVVNGNLETKSSSVSAAFGE